MDRSAHRGVTGTSYASSFLILTTGGEKVVVDRSRLSAGSTLSNQPTRTVFFHQAPLHYSVARLPLHTWHIQIWTLLFVYTVTTMTKSYSKEIRKSFTKPGVRREHT